MYAITSDLPLMEKMSLGMDRWAVYAALALTPTTGAAFQLTPGYIVSRPRRRSVWTPWLPVVEGDIDPDASGNVTVIGDADDLLLDDKKLYAVIDPIIQAEGLDGIHPYTIHRGLLIKPAAGLALPGHVVAYRDGSLFSDCWPIDSETGGLIADPELYIDTTIIGRIDMDKLDV